MKNCIKQLGFAALFIFSAMVFSSCDEWASDTGGVPLPDNFITQSGGVITAFEGNVTLTFPRNALSGVVGIHVDMCLDQKECNYLLRPIIIEPAMTFNQPVNVTLKYDGLLAVSPIEMPENSLLMATIWESEMDFFNNQSCGNCICCVDEVLKTITFCICSSGIITIERPKEEGQ